MFPATVLDLRRPSTELVRLALAVPAEVAQAYTRSGQYVTLHTSTGTVSTLAMASPPGGATLEFLSRRGNPVTDALLESREPAVQLTVPEGRGFPVEETAHRRLVLIGAGTGMAPLRAALLQRGARQGLAGVTVLVGARSGPELPFADEFSQWTQQGAHVHVALSRPHAEWKGTSGYVQSLFPLVDFTEASAFLCGPLEMVRGCTEALQALGAASSNLHLNF